MQTSSVAAKVKHLFELCKEFEEKVWKWRRFLTDVGCFEMQNAASASQSGLSTNHIGRFGGLDVTLDKVSCTLIRVNRNYSTHNRV